MAVKDVVLRAVLLRLWNGGELLLELEAHSWRCWEAKLKSWHGAGRPNEVRQVEPSHALVLLWYIFMSTACFLLSLFLEPVNSELLILML